MDKRVLSEYIDAKALIAETEADIRKLEKKRRTIVTGNVKGSNPEFPYNPQHFRIAGTAFKYDDDDRLRHEKRILEERKKKAKALKLSVDAWMNTISMRMQRIIRLKYFEGLSWEQVADQMGKKATGDSVRMEFNNFMKDEN